MSVAPKASLKPKFLWVSLASPLLMRRDSIPFRCFVFLILGRGWAPWAQLSIHQSHFLHIFEKHDTTGTRKRTGMSPNPTLEKEWRRFSEPGSHFTRNDLEDQTKSEAFKGDAVSLPRKGGERDLRDLEGNHWPTPILFRVLTQSTSLYMYFLSSWGASITRVRQSV